MLVVFSDLDGTLLDRHSYSFEAARPALDLLRTLAVPLVMCTSKTRAEVEAWRVRLDNGHPFIVENGAALYVPRDYFACQFDPAVLRGEYAVIEIGRRYPEIVGILQAASRESGCRVRGFHAMSVEEISSACGLPVDQAVLAKRREYDEPFEILDGDPQPLLQAIDKHKGRWSRGGRFYHVHGNNDKAHCVNLLTHYYERSFQQPIVTVGLGDGLNDAGFLNSVNIPIILASPHTPELRALVPRAWVLELGGPVGWNTAIIKILKDQLSAPPQSGIQMAGGPEG